MTLALLALTVCGGPSSKDERRLSELIDQTATAISRGDWHFVTSLVSPHYRSSEGWDRDRLLDVLDRHASRGDWVEVVVTRRNIEVTGDRATAEVTALLSQGGDDGARMRPQRVRLDLAREGGEWRVISSSHRHAEIGDFLR